MTLRQRPIKYKYFAVWNLEVVRNRKRGIPLSTKDRTGVPETRRDRYKHCLRQREHFSAAKGRRVVPDRVTVFVFGLVYTHEGSPRLWIHREEAIDTTLTWTAWDIFLVSGSSSVAPSSSRNRNATFNSSITRCISSACLHARWRPSLLEPSKMQVASWIPSATSPLPRTVSRSSNLLKDPHAIGLPSIGSKRSCT